MRTSTCRSSFRLSERARLRVRDVELARASSSLAQTKRCDCVLSGAYRSAMKTLTPSQKGAAAEAAITAAVIQLGLTVLRPLCEGRRYDLIVDLEPALLRVQCKLARQASGVLSIRMQ